jgi:hypothetical protein
MLSEGLLALIVTSSSGIILSSFALCYKSKCQTISLCFGCVKVTRNVDVEMEEDLDQNKAKDSDKVTV